MNLSGLASATHFLPERMKKVPTFLMMQLVGEAYKRASRSPFRNKLDPAQASSVRLPHYAIMSCLIEFGASSQKELSVRLGLDPSDMVGFIDALEKAGFAQRLKDGVDRRKNALVITDLGRKIVEERDSLADKATKEFYGVLNDEELAQLSSMLLRVLEYQRSKAQATEPENEEKPDVKITKIRIQSEKT